MKRKHLMVDKGEGLNNTLGRRSLKRTQHKNLFPGGKRLEKRQKKQENFTRVKTTLLGG